MNDTIVALSSGHVKAAISIIRLSGDATFAIIDKIFSRLIPNKEHQKIYYGNIIFNDEVIDEVMLATFVSPNTFTSEDIAEIYCHGSPYIVSRIIEICLILGARMALNGEFTQRAYLNNHIDLIKAESIADLVNSTNKSQARLALTGIKGTTSKYIETLADEILALLAHIEVNIDYPEYDDVEEMTHILIAPTLNDMIEKLNIIIEDTKKGSTIKNGINAIILGKPNVGKSSLLNALLKEDKAIVTNIAGTTRDLVEGKIVINGIAINLIDTAGIHESSGKIEQIGIEKAKKALFDAELVLVVIDNSKKITEEDELILKLSEGKKRLIVLNKSDLKQINHIDGIKVAAKNNEVKNLELAIEEMFKKYIYNDEPLLFNARHLSLLEICLNSLKDSYNQAIQGQVIDIIAVDINIAYKAILEILGKTNKENFMETIFSKFCLGK